MTNNNNQVVRIFCKPKNIQQADALEHFQALSPEEATELLAEMYAHYALWYNDQQRALAIASGD